ncbi:SPOR domain-containing protein [Ancylobacter terrae]|uniref:SPOR domain-containing protein n=1 Tax=Ancylobacter sp. sgz301288 TaxID=3342077 RepID=UPI00385D880E
MGNDSRLQQVRDEPVFGGRGSSPRPAEDPLAELARLIGQDDPFADFFQGGGQQAAREARPAPVARQPAPFTRRDPAADEEPVPVYPAEPEVRRPRVEPPAPRPASAHEALRDFERPTRPVEPIRAAEPVRPAAYDRAAADYSHADPVPAERGFAERPRSERAPAERPAPVMRAAPEPAPRAPLRAPEPSPAYRSGADAVSEALFAEPAPVRPAPAARAPVRPAEPEIDIDFEEAIEAIRREPAPPAETSARGRQPLAMPPRPVAPAAEARARTAERREAEEREGYDYSRTADDEDHYDDGSYDPDDEFEDYEDEEEAQPSGLRRKMMIVAAFLGLVGVSVAGIYGYRFFTGGHTASVASDSGSAPVIRADQGPNKVVPPPSETDTASSDSQKLIYDRVGGGTVSGKEQMVSREEQPVDVSQAAQPQQPRVILPPTGGATQTPSTPAPLGAMPTIGSPVQPSANAAEPKRVRTLQVRADGTIVAPSAADAPDAPAAPVDSGSSSVAYAPATPDPAPANVPVPAARAAAPAPAAAATPAPATTASTGGFVVQIAAQRSEAEAQSAWKQVQARYPAVLGSQRVSIRRADLGDRGIYYRAQVGPFASRDQANELCQNLRAQGGDCMVQRN